MNNQVIPHRFFQNVQAFSDKAAVLTKVSGIFRPVTYRELGTIVRAIALVLDSWGIRKGDRIALMSDNREEWFMSDMACISIGAVCVPVYPTLSAMQISELMKHSEPRMIFFSTQDLLKKIRESNYQFESIVSFDQIAGETDVQWLRDIIESGKRIDAEKPEQFQTLMNSVKESDLACINYTSGTTGSPKGVMLSHANFVKDVDNSVKMLHIYPEDTFLSFLPLSHVLERMGGYYVPMLLGATVGFAESIEKVIENMSEVHPTILISVPRLFEKIYATVMSSVQSGSSLKKKIFYWGLKAGKDRMKADIEETKLGWWKQKKVNLADKLVFSKLQQKTGGRLQRFVSGGAPLSPEIAEFLYSAGLRIYEGYGLTETSPVIAVNGPGNVRLGSVGRAVPETEFKIATDGEILVKGPQVMVGYYKNEAATRDVIDADGFFHTGDIGHFDDDNFLYITDRKKNLIITAGGKNVAPQPIEEALKLSPYIAESVLIGDRKNFISALTVLDQAAMKKWAEAHQIPFEPYTDFIRREEVLKLIESEIENQTAHFSRFEKVKKFRIIPKDFTIDDGEITPSLKVKKKVVLEKYAALVNEMYRE
ncbi:MAG: long-chain fatty acid--CoA ligase [Candidatus Marinimicrobia bacterium]|nr:long-chain fatty acid--CoA ligase [Candidatus Neomarinimicrobiota bacterium]